ncbi:MAG TPA: hypothetical protein VGK67_17010 [Myxococcales bacterium]|jgi:hypothetical protein
MLSPLLLVLGSNLLAAAAPAAPAAATASTAPPPAALVDALLSRDEPTWRQAALELSFTGPEGVRAVAARGERLKESHRAVQTWLMLSLLQSATPQDLRAAPALKNFWEPAVAEARQWMQRPIVFPRPGPKVKPPGSATEQETPDQKEAIKNLHAVRRMQGFLVPLFLERLASPEPDATLDAILAMERLQAWGARAEVEKVASDPKRGADDVAAKSARRYLESWAKARAAPHAAALKPLLAAMATFEEAGEPDALWKGLQEAAPGALSAQTAEQFWSKARPAFAAFWRAAATPVEGRAAAMARWSDRNRGYSLAYAEGPAPQKLKISGPAGASATVTDLGTGKPVKQGKLPLAVEPVPTAGCRATAQIAGRKVEVQVPARADGAVDIEFLPPEPPEKAGASRR